MTEKPIRYLYAFVPLLVLSAVTLLSFFLTYFLVTVWDSGLPFRTIIKKLTQLLLVLSIFPAMHYLKLNKFDLGFTTKKIFIKQLLQGGGIGMVTLAPVFVVLYLLNVNVIDGTQPWTLAWLSKKLILELLLALLISFFEEPIFRGVILVGLSRKLPLHAAIIISAFYYASLHFLDKKTTVTDQGLDWFSGFQMLGEAFANLLNPEIITAFIALFMVGIFLSLLRIRIQGSLGLCIGCHACWVWLIKLSKAFFNTNPGSDYLYLVSGYDGVIGPLVAAWLALAIIGYLLYQRRCRQL